MSGIEDIRARLEICFGLCNPKYLPDYSRDDLEDAFEEAKDAVRTLLKEQDQWKAYAGFCRSCALSGEKPGSFEDFIQQLDAQHGEETA